MDLIEAQSVEVTEVVKKLLDLNYTKPKDILKFIKNDYPDIKPDVLKTIMKNPDIVGRLGPTTARTILDTVTSIVSKHPGISGVAIVGAMLGVLKIGGEISDAYDWLSKKVKGGIDSASSTVDNVSKKISSASAEASRNAAQSVKTYRDALTDDEQAILDADMQALAGRPDANSNPTIQKILAKYHATYKK
jgi:hypothetical protein